MKPLTGLFIGAGFSHEAGMPLVSELTNELKSWLTEAKLRQMNEAWKAQNGGQPEELLLDFISVLKRSDMHYEAILGHLSTQSYRRRGLGQEYHWQYAWLIQMIHMMLYYRQVNNYAFLENNLPFYDGLRVLADSNQPLWIFSLNHDVIVEAIAARLGIKLFSGFSPDIITLSRRDKLGAKKGEIRAESRRSGWLKRLSLAIHQRPDPSAQSITSVIAIPLGSGSKTRVTLLPIADVAERGISRYRMRIHMARTRCNRAKVRASTVYFYQNTLSAAIKCHNFNTLKVTPLGHR